MLYGYVRVSTVEQSEERQVRSMLAEGVEPGNVYVDKASGKDMDRPMWRALMSRVGPGDTVVLDSLDRLGRSYDDVTVEWRRLTREAGVQLRVLDLPFFDSEGFAAMGDVGRCVEDMLLSLLAYVAETERAKMLRRQAEGIAVARERGAYKGRARKSFDLDVIDEANAMLASGGTKADVARLLGVHRNTVDNMIRDGRLVA